MIEDIKDNEQPEVSEEGVSDLTLEEKYDAERSERIALSQRVCELEKTNTELMAIIDQGSIDLSKD